MSIVSFIFVLKCVIFVVYKQFLPTLCICECVVRVLEYDLLIFMNLNLIGAALTPLLYLKCYFCYVQAYSAFVVLSYVRLRLGFCSMSDWFYESKLKWSCIDSAVISEMLFCFHSFACVLELWISLCCLLECDHLLAKAFCLYMVRKC